MSKQGDTQERYGPVSYDSELERMCGYLKNDSVVRWATGATQAQVDAARAAIAGKSRFITTHLRASDDTGQDDMKRRRELAAQGNYRYLRAVARAHG